MNHPSFTRVAALAVSVVALGAWAQSVPSQLAFTANLSNSGAPATGNHAFAFALYPTAVGGAAAWSETQPNIPVNNGLVFASIGAVTPVPGSILTGAPLYLEVSVDGTALAPRTLLLSVPYAMRAGEANTLSGLTTTDLQLRVTGTCGAGNAVQTIDAAGGVSCAPVGSVTAVTAGSGLAGGTITGAGTLSIGNGAVTNAMLANSGVAIAAASPLSGGGAVPLGGSTTVGLANCPAGGIYKMNAAGTAWGCGTDVDTNTTYSATAPIALAGTSFGLTACGPGQIYKTNAAGTAWACSPDSDTVYTDAMAVAAVAAQTVTHTTSYGPTDFALATLTGTPLNCLLPSSNCALPVGATTTLYIDLRIPGPSTLTSISCRIRDDDAVGNITMRFYNDSVVVASVATAGVPSLSNLTLTGLTQLIDASSRGPVLTMTFGSAAAQPAMYIYYCSATYDTNGL